MTNPGAIREWPIRSLVAIGALLTLLSASLISDLRIEGDIYGLLGHDDPAVIKFNSLAAVTPGLEELLVVCEPGSALKQDTVSKLLGLNSIRDHSRTYVQTGTSSVYGFALTVDPADWHETQPVLAAVQATLDDAGADCGLTGTPAIVYDMQSRLNTDLKTALAIATVFVSLLFAFIYRIGWLALLMLVPVFAGIAWGVAAYSVVRGELTLLATTVPTLLIGIGIDHCIHLIQSVRYSLAGGESDQKAAVLLAWRRLLGPITLATMTTTATFLALTMAGLRGLADLGWSGALVTLGVYLACITLLPTILLLAPRKWLTRTAVFDHPIRRLAGWLRGHAGLVTIVFLLAGAASLAGLSQLESIDDNRLLESGDLASLRLQDRIADEHGLSSSPILLQFDNPDDAIELLAEIDRPDSIGSLLAISDVPGLLQVHTIENTFIRRNYRATMLALQSWIDEVDLGPWQISGGPVLNERINELVYADVRVVLPAAVMAILLVLTIGTRSLLKPVLVLLPLSLALIWLLGTMSLFGVAASVVTVAIAPLVLGVGVDGGVHLLSSWHRHQGVLTEVFAETGLAIVITFATSATAFAAFLFARSPSLVYFGSQAAFALAGCLFVTLAVLPFLFRRLLPHHRGAATGN